MWHVKCRKTFAADGRALLLVVREVPLGKANFALARDEQQKANHPYSTVKIPSKADVRVIASLFIPRFLSFPLDFRLFFRCGRGPRFFSSLFFPRQTSQIHGDELEEGGGGGG